VPKMLLSRCPTLGVIGEYFPERWKRRTGDVSDLKSWIGQVSRYQDIKTSTSELLFCIVICSEPFAVIKQHMAFGKEMV
jgi:hypothetical protein